MSKALTFKRNSGGNLYCRTKGNTDLTIYKDKDGGYWWRIWRSKGKLTVSEQSFPTEDAAMDDLVESLAVAGIVGEL